MPSLNSIVTGFLIMIGAIIAALVMRLVFHIGITG